MHLINGGHSIHDSAHGVISISIARSLTLSYEERVRQFLQLWGPTTTESVRLDQKYKRARTSAWLWDTSARGFNPKYDTSGSVRIGWACEVQVMQIDIWAYYYSSFWAEGM